MSLLSGFSETDITPLEYPIRTYMNTVETFLDPLFAHAAVFQNNETTIILISLDIVIIEWQYVEIIRQKISEKHNIPQSNITVCTTHNHACPAVIERGTFKKEEPYIEFMINQSVIAVDQAITSLTPTELGTATGFESRISFNRRYIKKNGTMVSQPTLNTLTNDILCNEGVVDPEIGVLATRNTEGKITGVLVNFACHACHLLGKLSSGFPGVLYERIKIAFGPDCTCLFLNGPCGNIIHKNYSDPTFEDTKERTGNILADSVEKIIESMKFKNDDSLNIKESIIPIKLEDISVAENNINNLEDHNVFAGLIRLGWYNWSLEELRKLHSQRDHENVHIQVFRIGDTAFGTIPAEYFSHYALRIKEDSPINKTFVISLANGWLGYIPNKEAFERKGGHESTRAIWCKMEDNAGNIMADEILNLINQND